MPFGSPFVQIRKVGHQLKRQNMGKHIEDVIFSLLDGVNEEDLQQGEVQVEQHIQNVVPH